MSDTDILAVFQFGLGCAAGFFTSIIVHELGHALFGKLAGLRIVACGIGCRRPFFRVKMGETCYYAGFPITSGLTLCVFETVEPPWQRMVLLTLGGLIASLSLSLGTTIFAFFIHAGSFAVSCAVTSGIFFIISGGSRRTDKVGSVAMQNDAMLIHIFRHKCIASLPDPGTALATSAMMRDLCRDLRATAGVIHMTLAIAALELSLGDPDTARETLSDSSLSDPSRGNIGQKTELFVRSLIDLSAESRTAHDILRTAANDLEDDPYAVAALHIAAAGIGIHRDTLEQDFLAAVLTMSQATGVPCFVRHVEALRVISNPPDNLTAACRHLLDAQGAEQLDSVTALWLTASATELLARRQELNEARRMFQESLRRLNRIAACIQSEPTRSKFQLLFSAPLKTAVSMFTDGIPLFVPEIGSRTPL
jgi:hypothetical protein